MSRPCPAVFAGLAGGMTLAVPVSVSAAPLSLSSSFVNADPLVPFMMGCVTGAAMGVAASSFYLYLRSRREHNDFVIDRGQRTSAQGGHFARPSKSEIHSMYAKSMSLLQHMPLPLKLLQSNRSEQAACCGSFG